MHTFKSSLRTGALAVILAAGTIAATATIASAAVVCNSSGECWQTKQSYAVTVYPTEGRSGLRQ